MFLSPTFGTRALDPRPFTLRHSLPTPARQCAGATLTFSLHATHKQKANTDTSHNLRFTGHMHISLHLHKTRHTSHVRHTKSISTRISASGARTPACCTRCGITMNLKTRACLQPDASVLLVACCVGAPRVRVIAVTPCSHVIYTSTIDALYCTHLATKPSGRACQLKAPLQGAQKSSIRVCACTNLMQCGGWVLIAVWGLGDCVGNAGSWRWD